MEAADFAALLRGAAFTVLFSVAAVAIGVPAGLGLALVRWARVPVASPVVAVLVSILRAAPAVTLALLIFLALPRIGLSLDPVPAASRRSPCPRRRSTARSGARPCWRCRGTTRR